MAHMEGGGGLRVSFRGKENVLKLTVVTDAKFCDYSKSN